VGNRLVSAIFGPPQIAVAPAPAAAATPVKPPACEEEKRAFMLCRPNADFGATCMTEHMNYRDCMEKMK
jgi:hypothetical protein